MPAISLKFALDGRVGFTIYKIFRVGGAQMNRGGKIFKCRGRGKLRAEIAENYIVLS
jgi:hypothetical protein